MQINMLVTFEFVDERKRERAAKHENKSLIPSAFNYRWQREGTRGERGREKKTRRKAHTSK